MQARRAVTTRHGRRGMTVIELMVTLAVAAILLGAGMPSFIDFLRRQRMTATVNEFFAAVQLARSEAISRGIRVDLVPAGDGADWARGWVVLIDANGNLRADEGDQIIFAHGPAPEGMAIRGSFTDSRRPYLSYTPNGHSRTDASAQGRQMGSWLFTMGRESRRIVINLLGRPRVCNPALEPSTC